MFSREIPNNNSKVIAFILKPKLIFIKLIITKSIVIIIGAAITTLI